MIDTVDEKVIAELQADGRLTMKGLAERVGLSSPAMIERVRRLEERGVVMGYRAMIAPAEIGRPLTALITAEVERGAAEAFLARLRDEPAVEECHRTTGAGDYIVTAHVASPEELERLVDDLGNVGARCTASLVLSTPISARPVTPPPTAVIQRTRLQRRRRRPTEAAATDAAPRRRGRPKGRKTGQAR